MQDALTLLEREWSEYARGAGAGNAVERWRTAGAVPPIACMADLLAAMRDPRNPDERDRLVYRLAVLACEDRDACRVVLQTVRPGLIHVAQTYCVRWGWEEAASMTLAAALERIVTYPADRRERPAANIVRDVRNRLHRARLREDAVEAEFGQRVADDELGAVPSNVGQSASAELLDVIAAALSTGRLSTDEADLILRRRVLDVPTDLLAAERGKQPGTVRLHRRRAEGRLALITRSTYDLSPAVA